MQELLKRIYIHVPFCSNKCAYCAFYSVPLPDNSLLESYLKKLEKDFADKSDLCGKLESVYIGGGTPSFLDSQSIDKIFSLVKKYFSLADNVEFTIEANPESLSAEKIELIANSAKRVSLGIQSFSEKTRKILGRIGNYEQIMSAIDMLRHKNIPDISCDLIYSVPGQSIDEWIEDINKALSFGFQHISTYSLTIEEGAKLATQIKCISNEDLDIQMWQKTGEILNNYGIKRYEISNYARPGKECKHNLEIWYGDKYLGFGPSASSYCAKARYTEKSDIFAWLNGSPPDFDRISEDARAAEILVMGLRTSQGWTKEGFFRATRRNLDQWNDKIREMSGFGLLKEENGRLSCTDKGLLLWSEIAENLI